MNTQDFKVYYLKWMKKNTLDYNVSFIKNIKDRLNYETDKTLIKKMKIMSLLTVSYFNDLCDYDENHKEPCFIYTNEFITSINKKYLLEFFSIRIIKKTVINDEDEDNDKEVKEEVKEKVKEEVKEKVKEKVKEEESYDLFLEIYDDYLEDINDKYYKELYELYESILYDLYKDINEYINENINKTYEEIINEVNVNKNEKVKEKSLIKKVKSKSLNKINYVLYEEIYYTYIKNKGVEYMINVYDNMNSYIKRRIKNMINNMNMNKLKEINVRYYSYINKIVNNENVKRVLLNLHIKKFLEMM